VTVSFTRSNVFHGVSYILTAAPANYLKHTSVLQVLPLWDAAIDGQNNELNSYNIR